LGQGPNLSEPDRRHLLDRYLLPRPRLTLAPAVAAHAHGGMDISDGLIGDLTKMLRVSGVSARVDLARVPLSDAAKAAIAADPAWFEIAATGGDDYELLVAVPPEGAHGFEALAAAAGVDVAFVGEAIDRIAPPCFIGQDGEEVLFERGAFSHF
jgi:thiamine-monophosphate kinase